MNPKLISVLVGALITLFAGTVVVMRFTGHIRRIEEETLFSAFTMLAILFAGIFQYVIFKNMHIAWVYFNIILLIIAFVLMFVKLPDDKSNP